MATFAHTKGGKTTRATTGTMKLSVGRAQLQDTVSIDYDYIASRKWVVSIVDGDQFGLQVHAYPLHIDQPEGLVVMFVDDKRQPVLNSVSDAVQDSSSKHGHGDSVVDMTIEDGETVVKTLKAYTADAPIVEIEGNYPTNVYMVEATINSDMLE